MGGGNTSVTVEGRKWIKTAQSPKARQELNQAAGTGTSIMTKNKAAPT